MIVKVGLTTNDQSGESTIEVWVTRNGVSLYRTIAFSSAEVADDVRTKLPRFNGLDIDLALTEDQWSFEMCIGNGLGASRERKAKNTLSWGALADDNQTDRPVSELARMLEDALKSRSIDADLEVAVGAETL